MRVPSSGAAAATCSGSSSRAGSAKVTTPATATAAAMPSATTTAVWSTGRTSLATCRLPGSLFALQIGARLLEAEALAQRHHVPDQLPALGLLQRVGERRHRRTVEPGVEGLVDAARVAGGNEHRRIAEVARLDRQAVVVLQLGRRRPVTAP